jgi:hypothetical protein
MNIKSVKRVVPVLMKKNIVPFLHGSHGLGKTQVVKQIGAQLGMKVIAIYLSTQEVGDLIGLLTHNDDGTVSHSRPEWFPTEADGPCLIFLDEFNRAHPDVLQAMLPFALDKTLHRHKLPDNCAIICGGNYNSNNYSTTDISDSALISRFCHIDFRPTKEEFVAYAEEKGADVIADFIRSHSNMLEEDSKSDFDTSKIKPNRRSWLDFVFPLESETELEADRFEVYSGIVGQAAAASFATFKKTREAVLDINKILKNYKSVRKKVLEVSGDKQEVRMDFLNAPLEELLQRLESKRDFLKEEHLDNLKQFLMDIPLELTMKATKRMSEIGFDMKNKIVNDSEFCMRMNERMKKSA